MKFKFRFRVNSTPASVGRGSIESDSIIEAFPAVELYLRKNYKDHVILTFDPLSDRVVINEYTYDFISECPINGELITYRLVIQSEDKIIVEHIVTRCAMHRKSFHEDIAADLKKAFSGNQKLTARHGQVQIKTVAQVI